MAEQTIGNRMSQATIIGEPQPRTWDDFERNCLATFGGGHRGECFEAFQHGMSTVFNLLRAEFPPAERCKAAPDLLEACKTANKYLADIARNGGPKPGEEGTNEWCNAQLQLSNAIRLAESPTQPRELV
jgi:hypothetical protein